MEAIVQGCIFHLKNHLAPPVLRLLNSAIQKYGRIVVFTLWKLQAVERYHTIFYPLPCLVLTSIENSINVFICGWSRYFSAMNLEPPRGLVCHSFGQLLFSSNMNPATICYLSNDPSVRISLTWRAFMVSNRGSTPYILVGNITILIGWPTCISSIGRCSYRWCISYKWWTKLRD